MKIQITPEWNVQQLSGETTFWLQHERCGCFGFLLPTECVLWKCIYCDYAPILREVKLIKDIVVLMRIFQLSININTI